MSDQDRYEAGGGAVCNDCKKGLAHYDVFSAHGTIHLEGSMRPINVEIPPRGYRCGKCVAAAHERWENITRRERIRLTRADGQLEGVDSRVVLCLERNDSWHYDDPTRVRFMLWCDMCDAKCCADYDRKFVQRPDGERPSPPSDDPMMRVLSALIGDAEKRKRHAEVDAIEDDIERQLRRGLRRHCSHTENLAKRIGFLAREPVRHPIAGTAPCPNIRE